MSVSACIIGKAQAGKVNKAKAERIAAHYEELESRYRTSMGEAAREQAALDAADALEREVKNQKRRKLKQLQAQAAIIGRAGAHPEQVDRAMLAVLDFDPRGEVNGLNVSNMKEVHKGRAHALMVAFINQFRSKNAGVTRRTAGLNDIVRELKGEASGNPEAKTLAQGVSEGFEYLRRTFNEHGGDIPKRADWGLPQQHNRRLLASVSKEEWVDFIFQRLDLEQMVDLSTGLPMGETKLLSVLDDVYETIVTSGLKDIAPGEFIARSGIMSRRQESRFLVFRDSASWMEYHERFGEGDLFSLITSHVEGMARDIAMVQVLGPNPEATVRLMENLIDKAVADDAISKTGKAASRAAGRIGSPKTALRDTYNVLTGEAATPGNQFWANAFAANRNVLTSAMLGSSFLLAISDRVFADVTSRLNGIPATKVMARHLKLFSPGSDADKRMAARLGFTAGGWTSRAVGLQRYYGEVIGPEWSERLADFVLRASFLSPWTDAGRWGFQTEFLGFLTENAGKGFDELPEALQRSMGNNGVTRSDWDAYRSTNMWADEETGGAFIRPQDMASAGKGEAADRIMGMIFNETEFAVPSVTSRTRAILTGGNRPGTLWGEVTRNTTLYKSFPVTLIQTHLQRAVLGNIPVAEKGKYLAHMIIGTAVMGGFAEQTRSIVQGKDPMPMDSPEFWLKALANGGGLGLFGDFLFSDVNRFGGGLGKTLMGPVVDQGDKAIRLTVGNARELLLDGEAKGAGRELTQFVKMMTPGRSLWYTRLATERLIFDELDKMVDPKAGERFARMEARARTETGQSYFARPGQGLQNVRSPDFSAILP